MLACVWLGFAVPFSCALDSGGIEIKKIIFQGPFEALSKHVLAEVPRQVCDYYRIFGISPGAGARVNLLQLGQISS